MSSRLVTIKQAKDLRDLGFKEKCMRYAYKFEYGDEFVLQKNFTVFTNGVTNILAIPTVDEAIDWLRRKYNLDIYIYGKDVINDYNVELTRLPFQTYACSKDIYAAKRMAISSVIKEIKKQQKHVTKRRKSKN